MRAVIERLSGEPADRLQALVSESERQGFRFVRRLVEEWSSAANRFDRPGEVLFAARSGDDVVGVCGLNVDPHASDPRVGRVRHLYVLVPYRRAGVGEHLVADIIGTARGRFTRSAPLDIERRHDDHVDLPRIRFSFARHRASGLRALIDTLNRDVPTVPGAGSGSDPTVEGAASAQSPPT